jgi:Flp pilus assembly protein TadG
MILKKLSHKKNRAQALVEFAIALPVLLLLLYGIIEIGRFLFMYSTVVTASRSAVRYAATTGPGKDGTEYRYQDCDGIRETAQRYGFVGKFNTVDINWDTGPSDTPKPYCVSTSADTDPLVLTGNVNRIDVTVSKEFVPIVPKLVPFARRTITATSSRSILVSVTLNVTAVPSGKTATTTAITTNPNPSRVGDPVTIAVTVTGGATPTGTVTISGDASCTITLSASGTGSCVVIFNSGGNKSLTAIYNPDATHLTSSATAAHAVLFSTGTTITSDSPDPSQPNNSVNVVVTINSALPIPNGELVSITGADTNCTITLTSTLTGGTGSCNVIFTSTGAKTITATYAGDTDHSGSSGTTDHAVLLGRTTTTTITGDTPDPSDIGQAVNVVVNVNGLGTTPTGTVNITGADTNCTITLVNGTGNCNVVFNTAGAKSITATYSGDATHDPSSTSTGHSVNLPITTTTITAHTPNPSVAGQAVSVTVTVTGGSTIATGTVTITGGDAPCTTTLVNVGGIGTGICNVVFSSDGTKTLAAAYNGDTQHAPSNATATHTVGSLVASPVPSCNSVTHGPISRSGNTMFMTITNPYNYDLATGAGSVTWNSDKGNNSNNKHLYLLNATLNGTTIWNSGPTAPNVDTVPFTLPAVLPKNATVSIIFTFDGTYDNTDGTESIFFNITTSGCNGIIIKSP